MTNTSTASVAELITALTEARDWFESQAKAVSKGCGSSYELHDLRVQRDALDVVLASAAAPAGATLPEGWVPLVITHEGQYPEEVAYGPQRMMDRLGKWLRKYFDFVAAAKEQPAPPADSVLEDAARLDWLESQSQVNIERVRYLGADTSIYEVTPFNSTDYNGETLREAIDAARKQGANHD